MAALNGGAAVLQDVQVVPLVLADVPAVPLEVTSVEQIHTSTHTTHTHINTYTHQHT